MKSYEEIASEVLEAARERRQQIGKSRRITAFAIGGGACVAVIAVIILLQLPSKRPVTEQYAVEKETITATVAETLEEAEAETEAPTEEATRPARETRTSSTTDHKRSTDAVHEHEYEQDYNNNDNENQYLYPDDDLEDLEHPAAPTQFIPSSTEKTQEPTGHQEQTAPAEPEKPPVVHTDPPVYIEPVEEPDPVEPPPTPVTPPDDGGNAEE